MAKVQPKGKSTQIATQEPSTGLATMPEFMLEEQDLGVQDLQQFVIPPRIKVVQKQSGDTFSDFDAGDVIVVPQMQMVMPVMKDDRNRPIATQGQPCSEPFFFVPLFFYAEWCLWNPLEMKGTLPAIKARTTDPRDPMVAKARNPQLWLEECPENPELTCRYVEHLNFIITLLGDTPLSGMPMVMSFARSEHKAGSNFAALIKMRKAPLYGCQFMGVTGYRVNNKGQWYGIDCLNPAGMEPFVQEKELFDRLKGLYLELKDAHENSKIRVDYEDGDVEVVPDAKGEF